MKRIRQAIARIRSRPSRASQHFSSAEAPSESQEPPQTVPADLEPYRYTPLPTNACVRFAKDIRLENGSIRLSLEVVDLEDQPVFTALSYTWGCPSMHAADHGVTADRRFPIICDGQKVLITENLHDFLMLLTVDDKISSSATGRLPIWIDALCIDQENLAERAQQVRLMAIIYRAARRVLVWLGGDDGLVDSAVEIILALNTQTLPELGNLDWWLQFRNPDTIRPIGEFPSRQRHWDALAAFFARSWFYRMWVFQEITVAFEIRVQCGQRTMAWSDLVHVSRFLSDTGWASILNDSLPVAWQRPAGFGSTPSVMESYRKDMIGGTVWKLQAALCHCRQFGATDPKDKVFAVGGISVYQTARGPEAVADAFPPDYGRTVQETFMRATHIVANDSGNLDLLHFVEDRSARAVQGLPSWVPDYSVYADFLTAALHRSYNASKGMEDGFSNLVDHPKARTMAAAGKTPGILDYLDLTRIKVKAAVELDEVVEIGECAADIVGETPDYHFDWLRLVHKMSRTYFNGQKRIEVFWRTLVCDNVGEEECPAPAKFADIFQWWLLYALATLLVASRADRDRERLVRDTIRTLDQLAKEDNVVGEELTEWPTYNNVRSAEYLVLRQDTLEDQEDRGDLVRRLALSQRASVFTAALRHASHRLFLTRRGYLGLGPKSTAVGDLVFVLGGLRAPLVLRSAGLRGGDDTPCFELVGTAYMHGFMHGEITSLNHCNPQRIMLV